MSTLASRVAITTALLLVGCVSTGNKHFGAQLATRLEDRKQVSSAAAMEPKPWRIGQWARFRTTNSGRTVSFEQIRVIADDRSNSCIEWIDDSEAARTTWYICLRWEPNPTNDWQLTQARINTVVRVSSDDPTPRLWDFEDGQRKSTLQELLRGNTHKLAIHSRQFIPDGMLERVEVPAGDFVESIRNSYEAYELWSHPEVPFGGIVKLKTRTGEWERVLLAYGESAATADTTSHVTVFSRARETCPANPGACRPAVHAFIALGWGFAGWNETADVETGGGPSVTLQLGQRLSPGLHLVEELAIAYGGNELLDESRNAFLLGVRWTPFRLDRRSTSRTRASLVVTPSRAADWTAFHLKATVGALDRSLFRHATDAQESKWAPAASAAIGWLPVQGADWALGLEYRYELARISDELQRGWSLSVLAQLSN